MSRGMFGMFFVLFFTFVFIAFGSYLIWYDNGYHGPSFAWGIVLLMMGILPLLIHFVPFVYKTIRNR